MSGKTRLAGRAASMVGGFSLSVVALGVSSLVAIPVVISQAGPAAWASVAVGQTIGLVVSILTLLGWGATGPADVAQARGNERVLLYCRSMVARIWTLPLTIPLAVGSVFLLSPSHFLVSTVAALSTLALGLTASWYFIGMGAPKGLLVFDTLPRVSGTLLGCVLMLFGMTVYAFALMQLSGAVAAAVVSYRHIRNSSENETQHMLVGNGLAWGPSTLRAALPSQIPGTITAIFGSVYISSPLLFVSAIVPGAAFQFALVDRIRQQSFSAVAPFLQSIQGWVPRAPATLLNKRVAVASVAAVLLGLAAASCFAIFAPTVGHLLGNGEVQLEVALTLPVGLGFGLNIISASVGVGCLVPLGGRKRLAQSAVVGSVVGGPALAFGAWSEGVVGAAWGSVAASGAVVIYQFASVAILSRGSKDAG